MSTAGTLLIKHGRALLGRHVITEPVGGWPGGEAVIIQLLPDKREPSIVFQVRHTTIHDPDLRQGKLWEIGVFEDESVTLLPAVKSVKSVAKKSL